MKTEIDYLGHVVSHAGIYPQKSHVEALARWTAPLRNKKEVRSFLGLAGYYRKFIPKFALVAKPLTDMTQGEGNSITWTEEGSIALERLKKALLSEPVIQLPEVDKPFILHTDASHDCVGAVLSQYKKVEGHKKEQLLPIAYLSRKLTTGEMNPRLYSAYDKEFMGIIHALKK